MKVLNVLKNWTKSTKSNRQASTQNCNVCPVSGKLPKVLLLLGAFAFIAQLSFFESTEAESSFVPVSSGETLRVLVADWCPYCRRLESWLKDKGMAYERLDIDRSAEAKRLHLQVGGGGIPITIAGTQIIRGFDKERIREAYANLQKKKARQKSPAI